ncbi:MAG TPA: Rieske 2Fe-2S domain-containing protein [Oligoflexia bacterium]|nr:Rieske 2Fe-2S domain-containing protein [Oligoflexia bacterium]HMP48401.1 Rieske 2Fe-2S domain-containing protein [Oligoflexia bacterium]
MNRRLFIKNSLAHLGLISCGSISFGLLSSTIGCERHRYDRKKEQKGIELDLGPVKDLLFTQTHVPTKAVLLFRDINGWVALSTRCTFHGCDLTYQEPVLLCPCCKTPFEIETGRPYQGHTATRPLPWIEVSYKEGHLYAHPDREVKSDWRFTTPEIEEAVRKLKVQIRDEGISDNIKIPKSLMGKRGLDEERRMFLEEEQKYAPVKSN